MLPFDRHRRALAREDRPAPFLRLGEVDDLLEFIVARTLGREGRLRKINEVAAAVARDYHIVAIEVLLEARANQQRVQIDRHPHRREAMIRYHDDVGTVRDTVAVERRAHSAKVDVGAAERLQRLHRAEARQVLRQVGIVLP